MLSNLDHFLLWRVFSPAAGWIDTWLHVNRYWIAARCFFVGSLLMVVWHFVVEWSWYDYVLVPPLLFILGIHAWAFGQWSDAVERDPSAGPFHCSHVISWRLPSMIFGVLFLVGDTVVLCTGFSVRGAEIALCDTAFLWIGVGCYMASCPRPPGSRRTLGVRGMVFQ